MLRNCVKCSFFIEVGNENTYKNFINKKLRNINRTLFKNTKFPTIEKKKYISIRFQIPNY